MSLLSELQVGFGPRHRHDERYKADARSFPLLVPMTPRDPAVPRNRKAWQVLERWGKPFLTAFTDGDPITRGMDEVIQARVAGARGLPHTTLAGGHFLQEDSGRELAKLEDHELLSLLPADRP